MRNFTFILLFLVIIKPVLSNPIRSVWPLQNVKVIEGNGSGWNEKFYGYKDKKLYQFSGGVNEIYETHIHTFALSPEHVKFFNMLDVNVFTAWNNKNRRLEIIIFTKNDKLVLKDTIKLSDDVDDLDLRFGQGRRPVFLFIKSSPGEYKATIWFDDREQVIFLQNMPILASTLNWAELSALIVTRSGIKPAIKVWQRGTVNVFDLPFLPIFSRLTIFDNEPVVFAVDGNSTLWMLSLLKGRVRARKILRNNELPFIKTLELLKSEKYYIIAMQSPAAKKLLVIRSNNKEFLNLKPNLETHELMSGDIVNPGLISGKLAWLESTAAGVTYIRSEDDQNQPLLKLHWNVNRTQGYPELSFTWDSLPARKRYIYRYIVDSNPIALPLPEFRVNNKNLKVKLANEANVFIHIQAKEAEGEWESPVYHIPILINAQPEIPEIALLNEITPYVVTGNNVKFIIHNLLPFDYYAEVNTTPIFEPREKINSSTGEIQLRKNLKPGRYYIHIRSKDPQTNEFSPTLHYLFFYQTYVTEFTVGTTDYNKNLGRLNSLIDQYKNAQSMDEKEKILKELHEFQQSLESDIQNSQ